MFPPFRYLRRQILIIGCLLGSTFALAPLSSPPVAASGIITVTNTSNSGNGSLQLAITVANVDCAGAITSCDKIEFNIPSSDPGCSAATTINSVPAYVCTISPVTALPSITGNYITVDGYAGNPGCPAGNPQPCGAQPNSKPLGISGGDNAVLTIRLDGNSASTSFAGLMVSGGNNLIKGLTVTRFSGGGILFSGPSLGSAFGDAATGDFVGTDGASSLGNAGCGVSLSGPQDAVGTTLVNGNPAAPTGADRDLISGNAPDGVCVTGPLGTVENSYIGTDAAGSKAIRNGVVGVLENTTAHQLHIGGTAAGSGNLISANGSYGIEIDADGGQDNIQGNNIGTDAGGTFGLGAQTIAGLLAQTTSQITIGGSSAAASNVVSGNDGHGIELNNIGSSKIEGNFIGTNGAGTAAVANKTNGVELTGGASQNVIGGEVAGMGNEISGNGGYGIRIDNSPFNSIQGNLIGTNVAGAAAIPNFAGGVDIESSTGGGLSNHDVVGGTGPADRNIISGNGHGIGTSTPMGAGVNIRGSNSNTVEGNYIGTDVNGTTSTGTDANPLGNANNGVEMADLSTPNDTSSNIIGGTTSGLGNIISGNNMNGIELDSVGQANVIQGNSIGVGASGGPLGNSANGVAAYAGTAGPMIGGTTSGPNVCDKACNIIADNGSSGVLVCDSPASCGVSGTPSTHVGIQGNSIHDNLQSPPAGFTAGHGGEVYLSGEDPASCTTPNTGGAPNDFLPCPKGVGGPAPEYNPVTGVTTVLTCFGCTVDFYTWKLTNSTAGGGSGAADEGHGGGLRWVGQATPQPGSCDPTTSGSCTDMVPETATLPTGLGGVTATATITYTSGTNRITDTSEFSANQGTPTLARVAAFTAHRRGETITLRWRMASQIDVAGFNLFSGRHKLNSHLLLRHSSRTYQFVAHTAHSRLFALRVLLTNGRVLIARSH